MQKETKKMPNKNYLVIMLFEAGTHSLDANAGTDVMSRGFVRQ